MMYKKLFIFLILLLFLAGCGANSEVLVTTPTLVGITAVSPTLTTTTTPTDVIATATPVPPTATTAVTETPTPPPLDLSITAQDIYLYPVPAIYAGDLVTFQVIAHVPENVPPDRVSVHVLVDNTEVAQGVLAARNLGGEAVGLLQWAWDTTYAIGEHQIQVILDRDNTIQIGDENPDNNQATVAVIVQDPSDLSSQESQATWVTAEGDYCILHVVTGTAAFRDLASLVTQADAAIAEAARQLGESPQRKLDIYLIDRVIGQGGYAGSSIVITYADRQYSGGGLEQVLIHEATHIIDRQFAPQRITFWAEGLAVWASGGHYKPEDLNLRTAALVKDGRYVPLTELINNFYPVQHEIGYLQAAGLVTYLVDTYGWSRFRTFYSDVTPDDANTLADAVNLNLQIHYNLTLEQLETQWLAYLNSLPLDETAVIDLETTIRYYDVMRRYQIAYDPTAYFLTAWLPYPQEVEQRGNTADLTRHPQDIINITLEVMLQATDQAIREGNYRHANTLLDSVNRVLDNDGAFIDPLAVNYLSIVQTAATMNYEAQHIVIDGNKAIVTATEFNKVTLLQLDLTLYGQQWILSD